MTNNHFTQLINKYAIIVLIGYSIPFVFTTYTYTAGHFFGWEKVNSGWFVYFSTFYWIIQLVINAVAAILLAQDMRKLKIRNNLILVMTVLFSMIGLTMFFITANRELKNSEEAGY